MADTKAIVSKIDGKWIHDPSSFHSMTPDVSTYTVTLGNPNSKFHSTITVDLPSDVMLKSTAKSLTYKSGIAAGTDIAPTYTPAAVIGDIYNVTSDGYINKTKVEVGDMLICIADVSAANASTASSVDAKWNYIEHNINVDDYARSGHVHNVSISGVTTMDGDVIPTGTVSTPGIVANMTTGTASYVSGGTCSFTNVSTTLGSVITDYVIDEDDDENIIFVTSTLSYDKVNNVTFNASTSAMTLVTGAQLSLDSAPVFTGNALPKHNHSISVNVDTGTDKLVPKSNQIWYKTSDDASLDFDSYNASWLERNPNASVNHVTSQVYNDKTGLWEVTFEEDIIDTGIYGTWVDETYTPSHIGPIFSKSCTTDGMTDIPNTTLEKVVLPDSVVSIGDYTFYTCTALSDINIPYGVTGIWRVAFYNCSALSNITLPNSLITIREAAFYGTPLTSLDIPYSVTNLGYYPFWDSSITSITLHDGLTYLGEYCFYGVPITSLNIPSTVQTINNRVAADNTSLLSVTFNNNVETLGTNLFYNCTNLTTVNLPEGFTKLGYCMFHTCSSLTSITLPSTLKYMDTECLGFTPISSITLPEGLTNIEQGTFISCTNLSSITIPSTLTHIGGFVFQDTSINSITFLSTVPPNADANVFYGITGNYTIYVPADSVNAYKMATNWSAYASHIQPIP